MTLSFHCCELKVWSNVYRRGSDDMRSRFTSKKILFISMALLCTVLLLLFLVHKIRYVDIKEKLVQRTIEIALVARKIPDYHLLTNKQNIVVSSENIRGISLPTLNNFKLIVLSPRKIKEKANKEGDFLYLRFKKITIGTFHAQILLDNYWIKGDSSKALYLSGGGIIVDYVNILGYWKVFNSGCWISSVSYTKLAV